MERVGAAQHALWVAPQQRAPRSYVAQKMLSVAKKEHSQKEISCTEGSLAQKEPYLLVLGRGLDVLIVWHVSD